MIKLNKLSALLLACSFVFASATPAFAAKWTMKISHAGPVSNDSDDHIGSLAIKEYIEKNSDGQINVEIYPGNQLGSYKEVIEQVQTGTLEVAHTSIDGIAPFMPELTVIDLPYFLPDDATARKVMTGTFRDAISEGVQKKLKNVHLVSICNGGNWRSFYTTKKQIKTADDLKGMKIRTINSPLQQEFTRQFGANPTAVAWGELYTALATGVADGMKIAINDILSNKMDEHTRFGILDMHTYLYGFYWVNQPWLDSLPADLQKVVTDGLILGAEAQSDFNEQSEMTARVAFEKKGGQLIIPSPEVKAGFESKKDHMVQWYLDKYGENGKYWLEAYSTAIEEANK